MFNSPANCRSTKRRNPKCWGHSRERHSLKVPEPLLASSYLAGRGIPPEYLQPITSIPVDFACMEVLRSDTLNSWRQMTSWLVVKMWLLDRFMFFHSCQVCRARWINDQFTLVNVPVILCLLPLQAKLLPGSQESSESQKNALFCGFLDKPLMLTSPRHAALHGWLQTTDMCCLKQHAKNKTKNQADSDGVTGHRHHHTSSDRLRNYGNNIWNT